MSSLAIELRYGLRDVTFAYGRNAPVMARATLEFGSSERVSLLVPSGGGKTTILELLSGDRRPIAGKANLPPKASWPIGTASIFHPAMSPEANIRSLCSMIGQDPVGTADWVSNFAGLGRRFQEPLARCSAGERARLGYAFSYAVGRPFYVAEDSPVTGDSAFMKKCDVALERRLLSAGLLLVTRNTRLAGKWAQRHAVLDTGQIVEHVDSDSARAHFERVENRFQRNETLVPSNLEVG